jgi:hypothetical protein
MQEGDRRSYGAYEKSFSLHDDLILRDVIRSSTGNCVSAATLITFITRSK